MDAQLPNSTAPILNDEYVVESNLFGGHDPEAPAVTLYAGASWREVLWPDMAELGEDSVFYPVALCADRIFSASSVTPGHRCSSTMCPWQSSAQP